MDDRNTDRHARACRRAVADVMDGGQPLGCGSCQLHRTCRRCRRDWRYHADFLDHSLAVRYKLASAEGRQFSRDDLYAAIMEGAVKRVRPKMTTVVAIMAGLLPILWSHGTGSEVLQRIAVPMIGGMVSSTILTLVVILAIYAVVKGAGLSGNRQRFKQAEQAVGSHTWEDLQH